jgi:hypothetical protein
MWRFNTAVWENYSCGDNIAVGDITLYVEE